MAIINNNRKILDLKKWELLSKVPAGNIGAGVFIANSRNGVRPHAYLNYNQNTGNFIYDPAEDGWIYLPTAGLPNAVAAGSCGTCTNWSTGSAVGIYSLSATSGTVSSITTNQYLARNLSGFSVMILSGSQSGAVIPMTGNTLGPSATIYFSAQALAFDSSTRFRLLTPRWYVLSPGTTSTGFRVYDYASNTWLALNTISPTSWGTDGFMTATPSFIDNAEMPFHTFNPTTAGSLTLESSSANWAANQWANSQVRVASGTGAGQIATVVSSSVSSLTLSSITSSLQTWNITADTTSRINIDGNDEYLYIIGNNSTLMYRYRISENRWEQLNPVTARTNLPAAAATLYWIFEVPDPSWNDTNNIKNGRYLYSFRGGGNCSLDIYDIAANTWINNSLYSPGFAGSVSATGDGITTGSKHVYAKDAIYIMFNTAGRMQKFDIVKNELLPWGQIFHVQGGASVGNTMFDVDFIDGNSRLKFIYVVLNNLDVLGRCMVI